MLLAWLMAGAGTCLVGVGLEFRRAWERRCRGAVAALCAGCGLVVDPHHLQLWRRDCLIARYCLVCWRSERAAFAARLQKADLRAVVLWPLHGAVAEPAPIG